MQYDGQYTLPQLCQQNKKGNNMMKKILLSTMTMAVIAMSSFTANADFQINSKTDLETFRNNVNNGTTYAGETIYLNVDIDMGGASWTPIANNKSENSSLFQGIFNGQGHTISSFNVNVNNSVGTLASASEYNSNAFAGLFGTNSGVIKNLKISNAVISATTNGIQTSSCAGAIVGLNRGTVTNCQASNCTISATQNYGAVSIGNKHMAIACGIAGATRSGCLVSDCYSIGNNCSISVKSGWGANAGKATDEISFNWEDDSNPTITNCCTTSSDYFNSWRKAHVDAAVAYVNNFGGSEAEPYWWNSDGITPYITHAFRIDNTQATISANASYDKVAIVDGVADTYTYDGYTYDIFPSNHTINVTAHPQGLPVNGDDAGYVVTTVSQGSIGTYQDNTIIVDNHYTRSQSINGVATPSIYPTDATVLSYNTEHTGLYNLTFADHGTDVAVRYEAAIITTPNKISNPAGGEFNMYHAGDNVVIEFYLEGHVGDWSSKDFGYYIGEITDNNGNVLATTNDATYTMPENGMDEEGNPTFSYETGRFLRKQQFTIPMPAAKTTLYYTTIATIPTSVEGVESNSRIYGAEGCVVIEAAADGIATVVDMTGRTVYNGRVSQGRNELSLVRGFYIVNGTKVIVR